MVTLYNVYNEPIQTIENVTEFDRTYAEYLNGGYRGKIYATRESGEYFDDPDNPLPPHPEEPESDIAEALAILRGEITE